MKRLTEVDGKGNWHIAGVEWGKCKGNLYGALCKLKDYEDTGLTPVEIMDGKLFTGWIPVSERLPDTEVEVLVTQKGVNGIYVTTNEWYGDVWELDDNVIAWMPLPDSYNAD